MKLNNNIYLIGSGDFGISNKYDCNVYLVKDNKEAILIDSGVGYEPERIMNNIKKDLGDISIKSVYLTHLHADHFGGSEYFSNMGVEVLCSRTEYEYYKSNYDEVIDAYKISQNSGGYPKNKDIPILKVDRLIEDNEIFNIGNLRIHCIEVKGHSPGHICFYYEKNEKIYLFSGDYVFAKGNIGLLNCPGSSLKDYRESIIKFKDIKIDGLFPGHNLFQLSNGNESLEIAMNNLRKMQIPSTF